ncbi:MAG: ATP-binding protein [Candidatus Levyibacteriota bacterium]
MLVHLAGPIDAATRARATAALAAVDGVRSVRGSHRTPNLLIVYYDPRIASTPEVLRTVQSQGFTARLVGF